MVPRFRGTTSSQPTTGLGSDWHAGKNARGALYSGLYEAQLQLWVGEPAATRLQRRLSGNTVLILVSLSYAKTTQHNMSHHFLTLYPPSPFPPPACPLQALSHFSYHVSSGQYLLCDIQGTIYIPSFSLDQKQVERGNIALHLLVHTLFRPCP